MRNLTDLDLGFNDLTILWPDIFSYLSNLKNLNLRSNLIIEIYLECFDYLDKLVYLSLNNNKKSIRVYSSQNRKYLPKLQSLYLNNTDSSLVNHFDLSSLVSIDLSFGDLGKINLEILPFPHLKRIFFHNTAYFDRFWPLILQFGLNLNEIDLSKNIFKYQEQTFLQNSPLLEKLVLSKANVTDFHLNQNIDLGLFNNLSYLDLSFNLISELPVNSSDLNSGLTYFYLSYNQIRTFKKGIFQYGSNLTVLDLSHNFIESIESGAFENVIKLSVLDLSFNRIINLDQAIFGENCLADLKILYLETNFNKSLTLGFDICLVSVQLEGVNLGRQKRVY
jgi:Leucine-rich repeat (LRR) protein